MGPIQTAIGQLLGAVGGATLAGSKLANENERQAAKQERAQTKEAGKDSDAVAKAIKTAQQNKIDSPQTVYFWGNSEEAIGTADQIASVLSMQATHNATSSKKRSRDIVRERKKKLMARKLERK